TLNGEGDAAEATQQRVIPDGTTEIVLNLADPFRRFDDGHDGRLQPTNLFVGPMRRHIVIEPTGRIDLIGIRFHPHGAAAILPVPLDELADRIEDAGDVAPRQWRDLRERIGNANETSTRLRLIDSALRDGLQNRVDPRTTAAVTLIRESDGRTPIEIVARDTGLSRRQLERNFRSSVGLGPKLLARITRLQAALRRIHTMPDDGWAALAISCGYADQPHFVRDFREFSGQSPSAFFGEAQRLAALFAGSP
ncbi:MAG: AraC family transcriptional regulator, partial [Longimicrobiales bacterium]